MTVDVDYNSIKRTPDKKTNNQNLIRCLTMIQTSAWTLHFNKIKTTFTIIQKRYRPKMTCRSNWTTADQKSYQGFCENVYHLIISNKYTLHDFKQELSHVTESSLDSIQQYFSPRRGHIDKLDDWKHRVKLIDYYWINYFWLKEAC